MSGASVFHQVYLHLTWSCRDRQSMILPMFANELHTYLRNYLAQTSGVFFKAGGGTADHIHLAVQLAPNQIPSDLIGRIKGASSQHINKKYGSETLLWQHGYAVDSFAAKNLPAIEQYLRDQSLHHERQNVRPAIEPVDEFETRCDVLLHVTWHCHHDRPLITARTEELIGAFLPGYCTDAGVELLGWGGTPTHLHLAIRPPVTARVSEIIGKLKGATSHHVNEHLGAGALRWQTGYGVVGFAHRNLEPVLNYIRNQKEHHHKLTVNEILEQCGFPVRGEVEGAG